MKSLKHAHTGPGTPMHTHLQALGRLLLHRPHAMARAVVHGKL